ncbi:ComEC/Rec2 family competence protein [Sulfurimonas sp. SAG-AH-194-I05]|nr:ComEC/Rec2 family competence protein [Sulfurimonas sp. SAG-AH-194-I05]MDF1874287.1 ComEC/Rec2 family competence protein [Sulfurimonas sp. SAG-AH-194-I05]
MRLEKVSLFNTKKDFFFFLLACGFIFTYALLIEYNNYKNLIQFNSNLVTATILKQYTKTKLSKKGTFKTYQVLKLKANKGFSFYTTAKKDFPHAKGKEIQLEIFAGNISFYAYITSFYAHSKIIKVANILTLKEECNDLIANEHKDKNITRIYQALYTATPLSSDLQKTFSYLGVSHLLAISGFHLGVLSTLLFFLFKAPYTFFQNRCFPYRSYKVDSFLVIALILFSYLHFLDYPPSLVRSFVMLIIGFTLYDRGFKVLSMWTLLVTVVLILSFTPRFIFSIGFWMSVSGVYYIFLFLLHFSHLNKVWQFILVPFWVYIMMLPVSLYIFGSFSLYHPLSILWTSLFTLFYPLSIFLHLIGFGDVFDSLLSGLLNLNTQNHTILLSWHVEISFLMLSLLSMWKKAFVWFLLVWSTLICIYSIYYVT